MSNIVVRMLLDTSAYESKLAKSKGITESFGKASMGVAENLLGAFGKLFAGVGVGLGTFEVFNKTINSSATLSRAYKLALAEASASVDTFFSAMALGDFSIFTNGIEDAINRTREFQLELMKLKGMQVFGNVQVAKIQADMAKQAYIGTRKGSSAKEIADAKKQYQADEQQLLKINMQQSKQGNTTYMASMRASLTKLGVKGTNDELNKYISKRLGSYENFSQLKSEMAKYEAFLNKHSTTVSQSGGIGGGGISRTIYDDKAKNLLNSRQYKFAKAVSEMKMDVIAENKAYELQAANLEQSVWSQLKAGNRIRNRMDVLFGKTEGGDSGGDSKKAALEKSYPVGSIDELQKRISNLQGKINIEINPDIRQKLNQELQDLKDIVEGYQINMEVHPIMNPDYSSHLITSSSGGAIGTSQGLSVQIPKTLQQNTGIISKETVGTVDDLTNGLNSLANMMTALNTNSDKSAAGMMRWSATTMASVAQAIKAFSALAVVEGVKSATDTPVVGWLLAGAAAMSVMAALASAPKYATGGLVPGNSYTGDKVPVLANSGELILNKAQQSSIASQLYSSNGGGDGRVTIEGEQMYITLTNYMRRTGKNSIEIR